jgi:hypothetical protein
MTLALTDLTRFRLADHLEQLVWIPPLGTRVDLIECWLVLSPAGQLPRPEPVTDGWALAASTKSAAQRAVILARGHGYDASWTEQRSRGRRAYPVIRFVVGQPGGERLLEHLDRVQRGWSHWSLGSGDPAESDVARSIWRAGLLAGSHSNLTDGSVIVRFATSQHARRAAAGAHALGVPATVLASRPRQRSRVQLSSSAIATLLARIGA